MRASTERDLDAVFPKMVEMRVGALAITADAFFLNRRGQIIALAARYGLPATSPWREAAAAGCSPVASGRGHFLSYDSNPRKPPRRPPTLHFLKSRRPSFAGECPSP